MVRKILWHSIGDSADERFLRSTFDEMQSLIRGAVPEADLTVEPLPRRKFSELSELIDAGDIWASVRAVRAEPVDRFGLFVYCETRHPAARAARGSCPYALWGLNLQGALSLTYLRDNKYLVWHEAFHLLGVDDHYDDKHFAVTCGLPTCLMQYAPCAENVRGRLLCDRTVAALSGLACGSPRESRTRDRRRRFDRDG